jgi:hypothetical protein
MDYDTMTAHPQAERLSTKIVNARPSGIQYEVEVWHIDGVRYAFCRPNDGSKGPWTQIAL